VTPLRLVVSPDADREIDDVLEWLDGDARQRFASRLDTLLTQLCETLPEKIALGRPPQLDLDASEGLLRPVFQERFYSSRMRPPRRSNRSVWRVFYSLRDTKGNGIADTLELLHIFHAAANLPWLRSNAE
jgi:plasmid stabilization system protein ParE